MLLRGGAQSLLSKLVAASVASAFAAGVGAVPAAGQTPQSLLGTLQGVVESLPGLPPVSSLTGNSVPNISSIPGVPEIQGITNKTQGTVTDPANGGSFSNPFAQAGPNCPNETNGSPTPAV